jgi:hypothetical protein
MLLRVILIVFATTLLAACEAEDPDTAYNSDGMPYSRSAYDRGRLDAQADLQVNRLILEDYGFSREGKEEFVEILKQRYGIELRRLDAENIDMKSSGHAFGYNEVAKAEIQRRFGADVIEKAQAEAKEQYRAKQGQ